MKTIYIDSGFMCHLEDDVGRTAIETDVFDGTVDTVIPYYRYIPQGKEYIDDKGRTFHGVFIQAINSEAIDRILMQEYISDMQTALNLLGVTE